MLAPLAGRMVALSRAGDARGAMGMAATALSSTCPVVRGCFAGSQSRGWGGHALPMHALCACECVLEYVRRTESQHPLWGTDDRYTVTST